MRIIARTNEKGKSKLLSSKLKTRRRMDSALFRRSANMEKAKAMMCAVTLSSLKAIQSALPLPTKRTGGLWYVRYRVRDRLSDGLLSALLVRVERAIEQFGEMEIIPLNGGWHKIIHSDEKGTRCYDTHPYIGCSCADWRYRGFADQQACKHMDAVAIHCGVEMKLEPMVCGEALCVSEVVEMAPNLNIEEIRAQLAKMAAEDY